MSKKVIDTGKDRVKGKHLLERAGMAMKHEFYLESVWLLSQLLERKLAKIARLIIKEDSNSAKTREVTLHQLLRRVKQGQVTAGEHGGIVNSDLQEIDRLRRWINRRNLIFRGLTEGPVSIARVEKLANDGVDIYRELNRLAKALKTVEETEHNPKDDTG